MEVTENKKIEMKASTKVFNALLWVFVVFFSLILLVYLLGVYYYSNHFVYGTVVDDFFCSNRSIVDVNSTIQADFGNQIVSIIGRDTLGESKQIGTVSWSEIDGECTNLSVSLQHILDSQNTWLWPYYLFGCIYRDFSLEDYDISITYSREKLLDSILALELLCSSMSSPKDAYIKGYNASTNSFEIVPENRGNQIKKPVLEEVILNSNAINLESYSVDLSALDCYEEPSVLSVNSALEKRVAVANRWLSSVLRIQWGEDVVELSGDDFSEWILFREDYMPYIDKDMVAEYVSEMASSHDTFGKNRQFTTSLGVVVTLKNGGYGWKTDKMATADFLANCITLGGTQEIDPIYSKEAYARGSNDIGSSFVEIDLSNQHLYLYYEGALVLESDFVSGNVSANNTTPGGLFGLTYKTRDAILRGDNYATPVSYWMPFNGNIGMHDATWRGSFGGRIFLTSGSHGCVNLPKGNAAKIYEYVEKNFPVICYYYPDGQNPLDGVTEGQLASYVAPKDAVEVVEETVAEEGTENTMVTE